MPVIILSVERPNSIFMNRPSSKVNKKSDYVRKGSWDWTGLTKEEMEADLLKASKRAEKEYQNGEYRLAKDLYKEWAEGRDKCVVIE